MFKKATAIIAAITLSCSALSVMEHLTESGTGSMLTASAAGNMTLDTFLNTYNYTYIDYDGIYGAQCVDLIAQYMDDVLGINASTLNGYEYYTQYSNYYMLYHYFDKIENTASFVPQKGDIMVWNTNTGGGYGHVAICTGEGNTSYFKAYDQNWGSDKRVHEVTHDYSNVYGVLRPKDQSNITGSGGSTGGGTSDTSTLAFGTLWVDNDIYIFNKTASYYNDSNLTSQVGTVSSGQKRTFSQFFRKDGKTIGKATDGYYYVMSGTDGTLTVNAYGTVNADVLTVRSQPSTTSAALGYVYEGNNYQFTKESGDWGYAPNAGGWLYLGFITG